MTVAPNDLLLAALEYAARGWKIIPLHTPQREGGCSCARGKECDSAGKHPRFKNWQSLASSDETVLRPWWEQHPDANVGIVTGSPSGLFVLDLDDLGAHVGLLSFSELRQKHGWEPRTYTIATGTGFQLYFRHSGIRIKGGVS